MPIILSFAATMPNLFTFLPLLPNFLSFCLLMPKKISFRPKYYYSFNQNNIINILSKNVKKKNQK
jgi:hypothetical protein